MIMDLIYKNTHSKEDNKLPAQRLFLIHSIFIFILRMPALTYARIFLFHPKMTALSPLTMQVDENDLHPQKIMRFYF